MLVLRTTVGAAVMMTAIETMMKTVVMTIETKEDYDNDDAAGPKALMTTMFK